MRTGDPRMIDQPVSDTTERVRRHLDAVVSTSETPGIQYLVTAADRTRFAYDGGWADIKNRVPMEADTTLMAYSMTKPITADAVLQLVEQGSVGLDDDMGRYLQPCPYGPPITIRQLLSQTSGIPNPIPLRWVHSTASQAALTAFDESAALARVLAEHPRLSFAPGARYAYSNISETTRALFYTQQRTSGGVPVGMTLGWHIGNAGGVRYFFKQGGGGGFRSEMRLYPAAGLGTVVMANATGFNSRKCLNAFDWEFLRESSRQ
jgi:Beta-lactamase